MKKMISIILCAIMLLSLVGCSEEAKLYEKYADIITMLEEENYTGVMGVVSAMAVAQQNEGNERPMIVTEVEGEWLQVSSDYTGAPGKIAIRQDGTCTVDGKDMLWLERGSNDNNLDGVILDGGEYKFCFSFHRDSEDRSMPYIDIWTCRVDGEEVYGDKHMGNYRNHPQYSAVTRWWSILDGDTGIDNSFDIYSGSMYYNDTEYKWKIASAANEMPVVITAITNDGTDNTLTLTMAERDGHNVMTVVNDATGESGLYYNEEYGYESSWPEYQYPQLLKHLRSYLNGYSFWVEELDTHISKNEARAYLYEQFKLLGDYKESSNIVSRFVILPHMLTKVIQRTTDQLGNVSDSTQATYDYDINGRMTKGDGAELIERFGIYETWSFFYPEYDAESKVVGVNISNDPVSAVCTPTYNEAGQLESMHVQTTSRQYTSTFTYDEQGRLIQLDIPYGSSTYDQYVYTYTYDDEGRVIEKIKAWSEGRYKSVYTYTYEGMAVTQQVESYQYRDKEEYSTTMVFTNDSHGCHLSAVVTTTQSSATYAAREMVYQYNDLYFFDDTGIEVPEDSSMPIVILPIN